MSQDEVCAYMRNSRLGNAFWNPRNGFLNGIIWSVPSEHRTELESLSHQLLGGAFNQRYHICRFATPELADRMLYLLYWGPDLASIMKFDLLCAWSEITLYHPSPENLAKRYTPRTLHAKNKNTIRARLPQEDLRIIRVKQRSWSVKTGPSSGCRTDLPGSWRRTSGHRRLYWSTAKRSSFP